MRRAFKFVTAFIVVSAFFLLRLYGVGTCSAINFNSIFFTVISFLDLGTAIPIIIAIFAVTIFYFGKLIADVTPSYQDKHLIYIQGLMFVIRLLVPFSLAYIVRNWIMICISQPYDLVILSTISIYYVFATPNLIQSKQIDSEKMKKMRFKDEIEFLKKVEPQAKYGKNFIILILLATLTFYIDFNLITIGGILYSIWIIVLSVFIISNMAICYGIDNLWKYNHVKITLKNGDKLSGIILKYNKDFVSIKKGSKTIEINKDEIRFVETENMKIMKKEIKS